MKGSALVITYHAVDRSPGPLSIAPALLREHLDRIADAGLPTLTVTELAVGLGSGSLPERAVALTFDDAFASVAEHAAPLLAERGQRATVFAVAGAVGGTNAWRTQPPGTPVARLADAEQLRSMAAAGWEIGSHGTQHEPLAGILAADARAEIVDSRATLEQMLQLDVHSFALPYGAPPGVEARDLLRQTYEAVCTTRMRTLGPRSDPMAIPRVDVHYIRRPAVLNGVLDGSATAYLQLRGLAARARRVVRKDYVAAPT